MQFVGFIWRFRRVMLAIGWNTKSMSRMNLLSGFIIISSGHPFANGNGRHARLMADVVARRQGLAVFTVEMRTLQRDFVETFKRACANARWKPTMIFEHHADKWTHRRRSALLQLAWGIAPQAISIDFFRNHIHISPSEWEVRSGRELRFMKDLPDTYRSRYCLSSLTDVPFAPWSNPPPGVSNTEERMVDELIPVLLCHAGVAEQEPKIHWRDDRIE